MAGVMGMAGGESPGDERNFCRPFRDWSFRGNIYPAINGWAILNHAPQRALVAEIEAEPALVGANHELSQRFGQKIQTTLARIWGVEKATGN